MPLQKHFVFTDGVEKVLYYLPIPPSFFTVRHELVFGALFGHLGRGIESFQVCVAPPLAGGIGAGPADERLIGGMELPNSAGRRRSVSGA